MGLRFKKRRFRKYFPHRRHDTGLFTQPRPIPAVQAMKLTRGRPTAACDPFRAFSFDALYVRFAREWRETQMPADSHDASPVVVAGAPPFTAV